MHKEKEDCGCKYHHRHHYHHKGYTTILKRTSETVNIPQELIEVAEIGEGDFLEIRIRRVLKPSERKKYHHD